MGRSSGAGAELIHRAAEVATQMHKMKARIENVAAFEGLKEIVAMLKEIAPKWKLT
jgi:hypothetical protein